MSNIDDTNKIQSALRTRILAVANTGLTQVYDSAPATAVYPYATFGNILTLHDAAKTERFYNYTVTIHIWTKSSGTVQARDIMSKLTAALDLTTLVTGGTDPEISFLSAQTQSDVAASEHRGILRFTVRD